MKRTIIIDVKETLLLVSPAAGVDAKTTSACCVVFFVAAKRKFVSPLPRRQQDFTSRRLRETTQKTKFLSRIKPLFPKLGEMKDDRGRNATVSNRFCVCHKPRCANWFSSLLDLITFKIYKKIKQIQGCPCPMARPWDWHTFMSLRSETPVVVRAYCYVVMLSNWKERSSPHKFKIGMQTSEYCKTRLRCVGQIFESC